MAVNKTLQSGSTPMLVLKLIEERDMYGYEMIETLRRRSDDTFTLKAGTLYPLLHSLEEKGYICSYEEEIDSGRTRKYYQITDAGKTQLAARQEEWNSYTNAVNKVLLGGGEAVLQG